jgi:hypothetical protein
MDSRGHVKPWVKDLISLAFLGRFFCGFFIFDKCVKSLSFYLKALTTLYRMNLQSICCLWYEHSALFSSNTFYKPSWKNIKPRLLSSRGSMLR